MATQDLSKLSYTELRKLAEEAFALADSKRGEEIKVLADAYAKKVAAAGFSIEEAIDALKPYMSKKGKGGGASAVVKYRDPANTGNTYGGRGKHPAWVRDYLTEGRKLEEFAV
ncbi:H-NS histone family protein [Hydrogenophaga sp. 2FB]|uniref:H-NS histone family protein n=1 Tax=Hydrogenophaga sp. 2FB TaxID=2502187 RepID=UPI0010F591CA|nr:H-NS histone family protein [Hydrogenophaga sp. 2FB]